MKEDKDNWTEIQQNMGRALDEMRIRDSKVKIKELNTVNNPLFERRMKKTKNDHKQHMIVEDVTREPSMISMRSVTPTNSRPSTPPLLT